MIKLVDNINRRKIRPNKRCADDRTRWRDSPREDLPTDWWWCSLWACTVPVHHVPTCLSSGRSSNPFNFPHRNGERIYTYRHRTSCSCFLVDLLLWLQNVSHTIFLRCHLLARTRRLKFSWGQGNGTQMLLTQSSFRLLLYRLLLLFSVAVFFWITLQPYGWLAQQWQVTCSSRTSSLLFLSHRIIFPLLHEPLQSKAATETSCCSRPSVHKGLLEIYP